VLFQASRIELGVALGEVAVSEQRILEQQVTIQVVCVCLCVCVFVCMCVHASKFTMF
jgi:hypothetical protein